MGTAFATGNAIKTGASYIKNMRNPLGYIRPGVAVEEIGVLGEEAVGVGSEIVATELASGTVAEGIGIGAAETLLGEGALLAGETILAPYIAIPSLLAGIGAAYYAEELEDLLGL